MDAPHPSGFAKVLGGDDWQLMISLHRHTQQSAQLRQIHESHIGLDPAGLAVPTRDDLVAWQSHLEAHRVVRAEAADRPLTQSPIVTSPYGSVLVFRDPDNIQLELSFPPPVTETK